MKHFLNSKYQKIKAWYLRYERWLMPLTIIGGFLFDYVTFTNISITATFVLLFGYWIVTGGAIAFASWKNQKPLGQFLNYVKLFSPLIIQFCFGSLLSSSLIFYWFSGAISVSWPIILALALLMVANEVFKDFFLSPVVQISVFFFATFSLLTAFFPYLFNSLSVWWFMLAGASSIVIFYLYILAVYKVEPSLRQKNRPLVLSLVAIFIIMHVLYFLNIIPPIPLSLKEAGMYHSLQVSAGKYHLKGEVENFWQQIIPGETLHVVPGETIYCYSAIFAPTDLDATIVHNWQYYDAQKKQWLDAGQYNFHITGGSKSGYKGYSFKSNLQSGAWRINVENERGQVLGRIKFTVEKVTTKPKLQTVTR